MKYSRTCQSSKKIFVLIIAAVLLFAGSHVQWPLFSSNQYMYFLKGLAKGGMGYLSSDWLANQTDPMPAFSALVTAVYTSHHTWLFYVIHGGLIAIYAGSLWVIARHVYHIGASFSAVLLFFTSFTLLHDSWYAEILTNFGLIGRGLHELFKHVTSGVAGQHIPGPFLQPASFGVFLLASIACFLKEREKFAVICAVLAATFHPTYIPHAALLTGIYIGVLLQAKRLKHAIVIAMLALILVLPITVYALLFFRTADAPTLARAQEILIEYRLPHHTQYASWYHEGEMIKIGLIGLGIWLARNKSRLFLIVIICSCLAFAVTAIQIATGHYGLALLYPWRLSSWLVPLASALLVGQGTAVILWFGRHCKGVGDQKIRALVVAISWLILITACFRGLSSTISEHVSHKIPPVGSYIQKYGQSNDTYLVPLSFDWFRLSTGLPIFVDWKSHPYRAHEVVEWYKRVLLTNSFYTASRQEEVKQTLLEIRKHSSITHIVTSSNILALPRLAGVSLVYQDAKYAVWRLFDDESENSEHYRTAE